MAVVATILQARTLITTALANDASLSAFVFGRVLTAHPETGPLEPTYPLVVTTFRTPGSLPYYGRVQSVIFQLWTYSKVSQGEASEIYDVAAAVLQAERLSSATLGASVVCYETARPTDEWHEMTRTWAAKGAWFARGTG